MKNSIKSDFINSKIDTSLVDSVLFQAALDTMIGKGSGLSGIGTYGEKGVHATLKYYYVPDETNHEIRIPSSDGGRYIADAIKDGEIYEIQSKGFHLLRNKLNAFLKEHDVTIIYPVACTKYLRYVDPATGEITPPKKSSKKCYLYDILPELYRIKEYLMHDRLHLIVCYIDMEEYKFLDGSGKNKSIKATKIDRFPLRVLGELRFNTPTDYLNLLPGFTDGKKDDSYAIPDVFTSKDIANLSGFDISYVQLLLNILSSMELIIKKGKLGRYISYSINDIMS